jgi:hypothetical protein
VEPVVHAYRDVESEESVCLCIFDKNFALLSEAIIRLRNSAIKLQKILAESTALEKELVDHIPIVDIAEFLTQEEEARRWHDEGRRSI